MRLITCYFYTNIGQLTSSLMYQALTLGKIFLKFKHCMSYYHQPDSGLRFSQWMLFFPLEKPRQSWGEVHRPTVSCFALLPSVLSLICSSYRELPVLLQNKLL